MCGLRSFRVAGAASGLYSGPMNDFVSGQLGPEIMGWSAPPRPIGSPMTGRFVELVKLDARQHSGDLFQSYAGADQIWDYMSYGPFPYVSDFEDWAVQTVSDPACVFYAIRNLETGRTEGVASYLRIDPENGTIEVGHINFSPALQKTRAATEAMFLMMDWAFCAGYRRYEWKCNALNIPSRRAAQRLGFSFEGVFRQAMIVKGRNRDTAWFSILDAEWPALKQAFARWLSEENFDADGLQSERLGDLTAPHRMSGDPLL